MYNTHYTPQRPSQLSKQRKAQRLQYAKDIVYTLLTLATMWLTCVLWLSI